MQTIVSLSDVAKLAGVHVSTASRALDPQQRSKVHPSTVERVVSAANDLGYQPNQLARGLRTNTTMSVGVVISDIENPLFGAIIAGVQQEMEVSGYSTLIAEAAPRDPTALGAVVENLIQRRVDGIVLAITTKRGEIAAHLIDLHIPVVLVNRVNEGLDLPSVVGDDYIGIGLAVDHLTGLGHRRIGHIAGPIDTSTGAARRESFASHMELAGLNHADMIEEADWYQVGPGHEAATRLLDRHPDTTALVCANDLIALGVYRAIADRGLHVGSSISVTGYNDGPLLEFTSPPLTTITIPYRQMGSEGAAMLLRLMSADDDEATTSGMDRVMEGTLTIRSSTGPPVVVTAIV